MFKHTCSICGEGFHLHMQLRVHSDTVHRLELNDSNPSDTGTFKRVVLTEIMAKSVRTSWYQEGIAKQIEMEYPVKGARSASHDLRNILSNPGLIGSGREMMKNIYDTLTELLNARDRLLVELRSSSRQALDSLERIRELENKLEAQRTKK